MAAALTLAALTACSEKARDEAPAVPAILVWHDEPPIGSALNHRLVRAAQLTADQAEARWGRLEPKIYTVAADDRARLPDALRRSMPAGWQEEKLSVPGLKQADLRAFSSGDKLFAALTIEPGEAGVVPVVILRNQALLDTMKPSSSGNPAR